MSERREHHLPLFGIFLLFLGAVLLLQTFGVLPWELWGVLWRFWPVLLIIIGLSIVLRHRSPYLVGAITFALLLGSLGLAIWQYELPRGEQSKVSYSQPLGSLEQVKVEIDLSFGNLTIKSLPKGSTNLVEIAEDGDGLKVDFSKLGTEGRLQLKTEQISRRQGERSWQIYLNRDVPLTFEVKGTTANLELDLSKLKATKLRMDLDLTNCEVKMPSSEKTEAYIKADLVNLGIVIPQGTAAKVGAQTDLCIFEIDEGRFPKEGECYFSPHFEGAQSQIEMELDCDVSIVQVE